MKYRRVSVESTVVAAENQVSSDLCGEVAILNLEGGVYYGLDAVGARVWDLIQVPRTVGEVGDVLLAEYEVELECLRRDLVSLLQHMADEGIVKVCDDEAVT